MPTTLRLLALLGSACLSGCASLYFHDAGAPPLPPPQYELQHWPYTEYWTGIVFNGQKIGFSQLRVAPDPDRAGRYVLTSQAAFRLRFLGIDKQFQLKSSDWVRDDLTLERFDYEYLLDGNRLRVHGQVADNVLRASVTARDADSSETTNLTAPVYPTAAIPLFPVRHGLAPGREYQYPVFDGETRQVAPLTQRIERYERSEVFEGNAFKTLTQYRGQSSTMWLSAQGLPVFEMSLNGVLISALESEAQARRYLASASVNKLDALLDFSLVRTERALADPRATTRLTLELSGMAAGATVPTDARQRCAARGDGVRCDIVRQAPVAAGTASEDSVANYLNPTLAAPSVHPQIQTLAREIAAQETDRVRRLERILGWLGEHIEKQAVDAFSALDVLASKKAECQGHAYLYTALARAQGIPTRIVNGLAYSDIHGGFLYHTWAESFVDGQWRALDPTFGQLDADATHVKLIEGETPAELLPLLDYLGRVRARIVAVEPDR
jgi:hypothetical protein